MQPEINSPHWWVTYSPCGLWTGVAGLCFLGVCWFWIYLDATQYLIFRSQERKRRHFARKGGQSDWSVLIDAADRVVRETNSALPAEVAAEAAKVPCLFEEWEGSTPPRNVLGIYRGFTANQLGEGGSIVLFLRQLEDYCARERLTYEDEVRTTYLHELGHHLGWDEIDVESRGL